MLYAPLVFSTESGEKFVTVESVYAIFESKPKITKENKEQKARELTPIIGGILAVDSVQINRVTAYAKEYDSIDVGCAINSLTFHVRRNLEHQFKELVGSDKMENVLCFFYLILDELYKLGTAAGLDIRGHANNTLEKFKLEKDSIS